MSVLGNLLWIVLGGGIVIFFEYLIGGLALCLTIVGIPFGVQLIKLAVLGLVPFGKEVGHDRAALGVFATALNIIWIFLGGIWISLTHLAFALLLAITIIGIPFAKQHVKLASLSLMPFGRVVKSTAY